MAENAARYANSPSGDAGGPDAEQVIDLDIALVRLGGSIELVHQLIVMYAEDVPRILDELRQGAERQDADQVKRAAHTLKGLAANFEARPAVRAALLVEQLAQSGDLAAVVEQLPEMESQFERLQRALDRQITSSS